MTPVIGPHSHSWPTCWRNCPNSTAVCLTPGTSGSLQSMYPRMWHTVKRGQTGETCTVCRNDDTFYKCCLFGYFLPGLVFTRSIFISFSLLFLSAAHVSVVSVQMSSIRTGNFSIGKINPLS